VAKVPNPDMYLKELDMEDPVDKAIHKLIQLGLVECAYSAETGELMVGLTDLGEQNASEVDEVEGFLAKAEKILDNVNSKC